MLERFAYFVNERHAIWHRRQDGLGTRVTDDPILRENHFTNVYRELDPGTVFAQQSILGLNRQDAIWFTVAYRMINRRQTVQAFGRTPRRSDMSAWMRFINDRYARNETVKTSRHIVPHRKQYEDALVDAYDVVVPRNQRVAFKALRRGVTGVGEFIGWQILCDLVEAQHVDIDPDFVVCGPGAAYALSVLRGERTFDEYKHRGSATGGGTTLSAGSDRRYVDEILCLCDTQELWLPATWVPWNDKPLGCKNIEHALCEWTKYEKILHKIGSLRDA